MEQQNRRVEQITNPEKKDKLILRPSITVLSGVPLSGKTYLAEKLMVYSNIQTIDVDTVRNEIDETRKKDGQIRLLEPDKELEVMINSYAEMCKQAEEMVNSGIPALMTGTFSRAEFKQPLEQLIDRLKKENIPFKIFLLTAPDEEIEKRIKKRQEGGSLSNIDSLEKYLWAKGFFKEVEFAPVIEIDTSKQGCEDQLLENLKDLEIKK